MLKIFKNKIALLLSALLGLTFIYKRYVVKEETLYLTPPTLTHWFGTDVIGHDIFLKSMDALAIEIITLIIVLSTMYILGLVIGMILSYYSGDKIRELLLNLIHYWVSLPVLLIALFLLILIGAGQKNAIIVMIFTLIPTQSLYAYNQLETVKKNDFVIAKISYGFSKPHIYIHHLYPNIKKGFISYTMARMPEILMMNLALNFLGLGVQPPDSSFGRMLFDGLAFMFSAWWMWIFEIWLVIFLFILIQKIMRLVFIE